MTERENERIVPWAAEMRLMHARLREALDVARAEVHNAPTATDSMQNLLIYCHGFCTALDGHHRGEDRTLFPGIEAARPDLAPVLRKLTQDHSMIGHLLNRLRAALERSARPDQLDRHLEGVAAVMESHFRYEERELLTVLESLQLDTTIVDALGPL